jgi:hypothetical protein
MGLGWGANCSSGTRDRWRIPGKCLAARLPRSLPINDDGNARRTWKSWQRAGNARQNFIKSSRSLDQTFALMSQRE